MALTHEQQMSILKNAVKESYRGSYSELWQAADPEAQQENVEVAETPQQQEQGLGGRASQDMPDAMVFPNSQGNFNTNDMQAPIDIDKYGRQGELVQSYKSVPPGVGNLPMGDDVGTVIERPAEYQTKGVKDLTESQQKLINWNIARNATGKFDDQLGNGELERQNENIRTVASKDREWFNKTWEKRSKTDPDYVAGDWDNAQGGYSIPDHAMFVDRSMINTARDYVLGRPNTTEVHETAHAARAFPQMEKIKEIVPFVHDYYDEPEELYSRLQQLRMDEDVNPNKIWEEKDLPDLRSKATRFDGVFLEYLSNKQLLRLMNEVADNKTSPNKNIIQDEMPGESTIAKTGGFFTNNKVKTRKTGGFFNAK